MEIHISTRGRVVVPAPIRRRLGLQAGDILEAKIEGENILLTPKKKVKKRRFKKAKIAIDPVSGFPVLTVGPGAPVLTSKEVKEMLSDFP